MTPKNLNRDLNCIPTPAECIEWNSGSIESLDICNGDMLPKIIWEIANKLEGIAGEDISQFDLDALIGICNQKAPKQTTLISILTLLRDNQVCLKDYIKALEETIKSLAGSGNVNVALKCFADFDSQGNSLGITREQLDQLVIDNLCVQQAKIVTLEGKAVSLQSQIDNLAINPVVAEPEFATCIQPEISPTSTHTKLLAEEVCSIREDIGETEEIAFAIGKTPPIWLTSGYQAALIAAGLTGYISAPDSWADNYTNLLLAYTLLQKQVAQILATCCAPSCDKITLGWTATFDTSDGALMTLSFSRGAGTFIPAGFVDGGSQIEITDKNGVSVRFITDPEDSPIEMDGFVEDIDIQGLAAGKLLVSIKTNFQLKDDAGTTIMTCTNCEVGEVNYVNDACCAITNTGTTPVTLTIKTCSS